MNPRLSRALVALAVLPLLAAGCRDNTASIQPYAICTFPDNCSFAAKCGTQTLETSTLDVTGGVPLLMAVEMHNQLGDNTNEDSGHVNTHDAHFTSYSLDFGDAIPGISPSDTTDLTNFGDGIAQQVIPAGGTAVIAFEALPIRALHAITRVPAPGDYDEFVVKVTFKGAYEDGSRWEAPYKVPIRICRDCVKVTCDDPKQLPISACPSMFQSPHGKVTCTEPVPTCLSLGTYCGSNPNVSNGLPDTLYVCTAAGVAPSNSTVCANGCDTSQTPNICSP